MTELHDLLERAAGPHLSPDAADIAADVARGVRALRRRRTGVAGGLLTAAVAAAAIPVGLAGGLPDAGGARPVGAGGTSSPSSDSRAQILREKKQAAAAQVTAQDEAKREAEKASLAAADRPWRTDGTPVPIHTYNGPSLAGSFQPRLMPDGAVVQGGNAYRLTIARTGDPDTNPDSFVGKIVVLLSGRAPVETPQVVESDVFSRVVVVPLAHPIDGATMFEVQFAAGLAWTDDEAVKFASSIDVLPSARSAKG
jgi:hypothetical protein